MELEAADAIGNQLLHLAQAHLALVRIDAAEGHHHVAVGLGGLEHFVVRNAAPADLEFGIDREHHEADLLRAVEVDGFLDGRRPATGLEVLALLLLDVVSVIVFWLAAGDFRVRVHVDGDQFVDFHGADFATDQVLPPPFAIATADC